MSRYSDPAGMLRPAALSIAGLAVATVAVVAFAAGPARPAEAPASPPPASHAPIASPAAHPTPLATPVSTAAPEPTATPVEPSAAPDDGGVDAIPLFVELDTADGHAVTVDIVDRTGSIIGAVSGRPGDGASVDGYALSVVNVDDRTLRLTWIDYPIANRDALFVDEVDGRLRLLLVQPEPTTPTDAIGFDRVLVLTFDHPVDARSVQTFLDGLDTAS